MYSSTVRDGGVRCKIDSTDSEHWDFIPIYFSNGESVLKHYSDTKDNPYGWIDMIQSTKSSNVDYFDDKVTSAQSGVLLIQVSHCSTQQYGRMN